MAQKKKAPTQRSAAKKTASRKAQTSANKSPSPKRSMDQPPLVVGIGASAGGLEALKAFFKAVRSDLPISYVIIQHLDPEHDSLMADLLGACTDMPVVQIKRRVSLQAGHVYVTPPNKFVSIKDGAIGLTKVLEKRGMQMPINHFLKALAHDQHEKAIGIIMSGMGADGSSGLREIKEQGGLLIVQDPANAKYDSMPSNAIQTGMADYIVPISKMPKLLEKYATHPYVAEHADSTEKELSNSDHLTDILSLMRTRLKRDFRYYKKSTLVRRIIRRMGIVHVDDMGKYLTLLRKKPIELENLFNDLLIGVTQFFRDPESFEALNKHVVEKLLKKREPDHPIRVWVPGCSSGEEAYSIAILLNEAISKQRKDVDIQVFATDIDARALEKARAGVFADSIESDVSPQRLKRFFIQEGNTYRANKKLREQIAFAEQNLISDPPFSRLDLICCRNLLIYVEQELQRKIISLFHYTLEEDGYLFLGSSETVGRLGNLFSVLDKKSRIYKRQKQTKAPQVDFPIVPTVERSPTNKPIATRQPLRRVVFSDLTHRLLSETYAPASVLINRNGEPLYFFGPMDRYLKLPLGEPHQDILAMARQGLVTKLRSLINKAVRNDETVRADNIEIKRSKKKLTVSVTVRPVHEPHEAEGLYLVAFSEPGTSLMSEEELKIPDTQTQALDQSEVYELERELQATREDLRSTIEEMETSNEELKASNEEAMSMNEELQSSNEELETSKEEMQSLNEELNTVNTELQDKVDQLEASRNDISNLLSSTDIGTLFLDKTMHIKRFTPAVSSLIKIQPGDEGRKLSDFSKTFKDARLVADCKEVFNTLSPIEREIMTKDGNWFIRRILPYRTAENHIEGVVITFTDITVVKKAESDALRMAAIIRDSNDAVTLQGMNGQILAWNQGAENMYGYSEKEALTMNVRDIVPKEERTTALDIIYQAVEHGQRQSVNTKRVHKDGHVLDVWLSVSVLKDPDGGGEVVASTERDVTQILQTERELRQSHELLEQRVKERTEDLIAANQDLALSKIDAETANAAKSNFLASMSHELRTPLNAIIGFGQLLQMDRNNPLSAEHQKQAGYILEGADHLLELVNDILDLAKVEANQAQLDLEVVDARHTIDHVVSMAVPLAEEKQITITSKIEDTLGSEILTDGVRFRQILYNLLSNAIKYNKERGTVTIEGHQTQNRFLRISVKDTGQGIAKKDYPRVFQAFHRLGDDVTRAREGTGIGLTVTKLLVERLAGKIGFESKRGQGSTFWIELPLATNTDIVIWTDIMSVGVDAIDADHQNLVSLLNDIGRDGDDIATMDAAIKGLIVYTNDHFKREERIMEACEFPELDKHRKLHYEISASVNDLQEKWLKKRDIAQLHELHDFLKHLWINHVLNEDTKVAHFTKGKEDKIKTALHDWA
ncbi:CheR family methyltransferase [Magnetovibrio sp. PR-2]|uniref:CheR family methyltransferase n=1 Tax=Magnetovibrio sp. PR-2 TaxID=3120356 RepID=UPI002FCDF0FB